jgi:DNA-binding NtrC family response regulator
MKDKIMVVDDDDCIRLAVSKRFAAAGYDVQNAASGEQALELMEASPSNVLFLDLNLPGMNGLDLCRKIREQWPWCICIAVTGYATIFELVACREAGFEDYFIKPAKVQDLLEAAADASKKLKRWRERQAAFVNK